MKMFSHLIATAMITSAIAVSSTTANAQDEKQQEFERTWYETCYTKKDADKCYQMSKEMVEKYAASQYVPSAKKNITAYETSKAWEKFQAALKAYYTPPQDAAKLEQLFAAGEEYLRIQPDTSHYVVAQLALAGANGVFGQFYKNVDKVRGYAEKALTQFEPTTPPKDWKPEDWNPLREVVLAQMNQFMGYYTIETKGNPEKAIDYLTKSTMIKNKDGAGWKDPNNYWLRANVYSKQYEQLRAKYDALPDDQKTGDAGKELLKQVNQLLDTKLIPDYARTIAAATKPEAKSLKDGANELFNAFWKFRTDDPTKAQPYIKNFEADPTVAGPPVPAKAEDSSMAAPAPVTTGKDVKLTTGGAATAAPSSAKGTGNGSKSNNKTTTSKGGKKRKP